MVLNSEKCLDTIYAKQSKAFNKSTATDLKKKKKCNGLTREKKI